MTITQQLKPRLRQETDFECLTFWPPRYWNPSSGEEMNPLNQYIIINPLQSKTKKLIHVGQELGKELDAVS